MRELIIVGAGPHGRETLDIVDAINLVEPTWVVLGFADDGAVVSDRGEHQRAAHLGPVDSMRTTDSRYVIGIGWPSVRNNLDAKLTAWNCEAARLVHPTASLGADNELEPGVVLAAGARVTTNVMLGRHVHVNVNAVVSHDCSIGHYTTLAPGVLVNGDVRIGERTFVGTGAIITPQRTIGNDVTVGAGAVVVSDIPDGATVKGVPGRW